MGVLEPQVLPSQLNTVEFYWGPTKRTSLFLKGSLKLGQEGGWRSDGVAAAYMGKEGELGWRLEEVIRMNDFQNAP